MLAWAEEGRPDPTGQGRYLQFGQEVEYPEAQVLKKLPDGVMCSPAGELVGTRIWNSTRSNKAVLSELSDKAQVAVKGSELYLCGCVAGYNKLFLIKEEQTKPATREMEALKKDPLPLIPADDKKVEEPSLLSQHWGKLTIAGIILTGLAVWALSGSKGGSDGGQPPDVNTH
ncbi:MAG: hypothetical protein WCW93_01735 [Candidatus Paceibacterota bacterium]